MQESDKHAPDCIVAVCRTYIFPLQVFTSDHALKLEWVPDWIAIIGSGYIGLEFADVYTALGSEVTLIEVRTEMLQTSPWFNSCVPF